MKVIFVTIYESRDVRNWSGTSYYLGKTLVDAGIDVHFIGNLESLPSNYLKFKIRDFIYNRLFKYKLGKYISFYEPDNLKHIAEQVKEKIKNIEGGIIVCPGTIPIAYLDCEKPIAFWSDATFAVMKNYYEECKGLNYRTIKNCNLYESNALKRSCLAVYSSDWAANSSIQDYKIAANKVKVIPFGSNITSDRTSNEIKSYNSEKSKTICKLLFIGQNWKRKGAETAIKVATQLNNNYVKTELTIVGCSPPKFVSLPAYVRAFGFVDKGDKKGENLINKLYQENHFFILPTIAECTPIVFSEANSFGLPVITSNTGGIASIIKNDVNGKLFDLPIDINSCAKYIHAIFSNYKHYERFSMTSFTEYLTKLNWEVSVRKFVSYLKECEK